MSIKVLYLYYDLMNLYGESGNIRILERKLKDQTDEIIIDRYTVTDTLPEFSEYDFIYCGAGTESARNEALKHLKKHRDSLQKAYESGVVMLFTGNSFEMMGNAVKLASGAVLDGVNLFNFTAVEQNEKRYTGDVILSSSMFKDRFVGFMNKCSNVENNANPFFSVDKVIGSIHDKYEGVHENNFFGTQLIGPILGKNPHFSEYIVRLILERAHIPYRRVSYPYEEMGYKVTMSELAKDLKGNED